MNPYRTPPPPNHGRALPGLLVGLCSCAFAFVLNCSAADRSTEAGVISAVGNAAPVACAFVGGSAGTACAQDTAAANAVAQLVASILKSLPTPAAKAATAPASFVYRGVTVTLPDRAAEVYAVLVRDGGA